MWLLAYVYVIFVYVVVCVYVDACVYVIFVYMVASVYVVVCVHVVVCVQNVRCSHLKMLLDEEVALIFKTFDYKGSILCILDLYMYICYVFTLFIACVFDLYVYIRMLCIYFVVIYTCVIMLCHVCHL